MGNFQYNCGSSNTLLHYWQAANKLGDDLRVSEFGYIDDIIRKKVTVAERNWDPDIMVIIYESYPYMSDSDISELCKKVPRSKRDVVDLLETCRNGRERQTF